MKRLGEFLFPLDGMLVRHRGTPSIKYAATQGRERRCESKVSCLRTQHNVPGQDSNPDHSIRSRALTLTPPRPRPQTKVSRAIYLKGDNQKRHSDGHNTERCYKPGHPVHGIRQAHHLHDFLQALFFLIHDGLYGQRYSVNPRNCHTQWHHVLNDEHKTIGEQEKKKNNVE